MRVERRTMFLSAFAALLLCAGCAPTFSREALDRVDPDAAFRDVQRDPDHYRGKWLMLGGVIVDIRNTAQGTFIEVLQRPVDRRGRPEETDDTEGRFIMKSGQYLDPAVYHAGKRISLIGEVVGQEVRPLGEMQYRYPVVAARQILLWEPRTGPQISVGVGVGVYHGF
ncbi:MAG TPA: Slp family lipoprotein [Nitrospirota bacterium]|nr:Slp family lipoprotein [Nitrospirota bacterium]